MSGSETSGGGDAPFLAQAPTRIAIILNPRSGGGKAARRWRFVAKHLAALNAAMPEYHVFQTEGPRHATELTRAALRDGFDRVVSAGGDGTHFEVTCGFFDGASPIRPEASYAILPIGTASDLRKTYAISKNLAEQASLITSPCVLPIDIGRLRSTDDSGAERIYHFNTAVHMGVGSLVNVHVNRRSKALGPLLTFAIGVVSARLAFKPTDVTVTADGQDYSGRFMEVIVAKGFYDGGGMHVAPKGTLDSGFFEVYLVDQLGTIGSLVAATRLYSGTHGNHPAVRYLRAKKVTVSARDAIYCGPDGEVAGQVPATLEVLPRALRAVTGPSPRVS